MDSLGKKISELCNQHYNQLPKKGKPATNQWTVLSAVLMEHSGIYTVITMATGTKCVGENQKCPHVVSDSHAEVLCLRLFRLFLLEDMMRCLRSEESFCLDKGSGCQFVVKKNVYFHFYSSCVMCGDATISQTLPDPAENKIADNKCVGDKKRPATQATPPPQTKHVKLDETSRTGAKSLLLDDFQSDTLKNRCWRRTSVLRTKPGRGPVCLSLSCSDKLMKRQFLGLQGGLLSRFLSHPIRFSSFSIGGEFCLDSVKRALFDRLPDNTIVQPPVYKVEDIFVNSVSNCRSRCKDAEVQSTSSSILWLKRGEESQHWASVKGKIQGATKSSSLTKTMLPVCRTAMFQRVCSLFSLLENADSFSENTQVVPFEEDNFSEQYQLFKSKSWYSVKKQEFCGHFEGWNRKMSRLIFTSTESNDITKP